MTDTSYSGPTTFLTSQGKNTIILHFYSTSDEPRFQDDSSSKIFDRLKSIAHGQSMVMTSLCSK